MRGSRALLYCGENQVVLRDELYPAMNCLCPCGIGLTLVLTVLLVMKSELIITVLLSYSESNQSLLKAPSLTRPNVTGTVWTQSWTASPACFPSPKTSYPVWINCPSWDSVSATSAPRTSSQVGNTSVTQWNLYWGCCQNHNFLLVYSHNKTQVKSTHQLKPWKMGGVPEKIQCWSSTSSGLKVATMMSFDSEPGRER